MKLKTLLCLLLTVFCVVSGFAQQDSSKLEDARLNNKSIYLSDYIVLIPLNNLQVNIIGKETRGDIEFPILEENGERFLNAIKKLLSDKGCIEVESTGKWLIVTDEKSNIKKIEYFVKILEESGFTLEKIVKKLNL